MAKLKLDLPPPPIPEYLREGLKDYPEYLEILQDDLNRVVESPSYSIPAFERAVWSLEDGLSDLFDKSEDELMEAEKSGDAAAIQRAKAKHEAVAMARANPDSMDDLFDYCKAVDAAIDASVSAP